MVNFSFISELEGGRQTKGYVPTPDTSKSGVTIGTGIDLGQMGSTDLKKLNLPTGLVQKLEPYLTLRKHEAVSKLEEVPLTVTEEQAEMIDEAVKGPFVQRVAREYTNASATNFDDLPEGVQTVIASVAFQYGDLASRTPNFWRQVTKEDWKGAYANLRNFGDKYPTRRNKEAGLLKQAVEADGLAQLA